MTDITELANQQMPVKESVVYVIQCRDPAKKHVYVGSCMNFDKRMMAHKSSSGNDICAQYNYPLYKTIRECGGMNNFEATILETVSHTTIHELRVREQAWMDSLQPDMNTVRAHVTHEVLVEQRRAQRKKDNATVVSCDCGGSYRMSNHYRHIKTSQHTQQIKATPVPKLEFVECSHCNRTYRNTYQGKYQHERTDIHQQGRTPLVVPCTTAKNETVVCIVCSRTYTNSAQSKYQHLRTNVHKAALDVVEI